MNIDNSEESREHQKKEVVIFATEIPFDNSLIGDLLKSIRKRRKYSQTRLGRIIGVNKAQVSKLESNQGNLTFSTLIKVFVALKVKATLKVELYDEEGESVKSAGDKKTSKSKKAGD